jgi:hypothetical protein
MTSDQIQLMIGLASCVTAVATVFLAGFVCCQLGALKSQVSLLKDQISTQVNEQKKWKTIAICEDYWRDPVVNSILERLRSRSGGGTDYSKLDERDPDAVHLIDYFDSVAIGIAQGVYDEDIAKDILEDLFEKAVKALILAEGGKSYGKDWVAGKVIIPREAYPHVVALYNKWFVEQPKTSYKSAQ